VEYRVKPSGRSPGERAGKSNTGGPSRAQTGRSHRWTPDGAVILPPG
jgi:hypothetical protein